MIQGNGQVDIAIVTESSAQYQKEKTMYRWREWGIYLLYLLVPRDRDHAITSLLTCRLMTMVDQIDPAAM